MQTLEKMKQDNFGQIIFCEQDLVDLVMQGKSLDQLGTIMVDHTVDLTCILEHLDNYKNFISYQTPVASTQEEFDKQLQTNWHMPQQYKDLDIAKHVLDMCQSEAELQRCGAELLMYQERGLFDLLKYLKYLVDVMRDNHIIWGVGRGSSVASFVLYKLGVHRIDSMYYNLAAEEFLR